MRIEGEIEESEGYAMCKGIITITGTLEEVERFMEDFSDFMMSITEDD